MWVQERLSEAVYWKKYLCFVVLQLVFISGCLCQTALRMGWCWVSIWDMLTNSHSRCIILDDHTWGTCQELLGQKTGWNNWELLWISFYRPQTQAPRPQPSFFRDPSWFLTPTHWSCMLLATSPPLTSVAAHSTFHTHITLNVLSDWNHLLFNFCESLPIPQEPAWISLRCEVLKHPAPPLHTHQKWLLPPLGSQSTLIISLSNRALTRGFDRVWDILPQNVLPCISNPWAEGIEEMVSAKPLWPYPETDPKTLLWVVPSLYLEERSTFISRTQGFPEKWSNRSCCISPRFPCLPYTVPSHNFPLSIKTSMKVFRLNSLFQSSFPYEGSWVTYGLHKSVCFTHGTYLLLQIPAQHHLGLL